MRFHGKDTEKTTKEQKEKASIKRALRELHQTRLKDKRPLGKLMGDAVTSSIQSLLMVGGFIILFSVINRLLFHLHITSFFAKLLESIFQLFTFSGDLTIPFIAGIFEITLGSKLTSDVETSTLMHQAILTSCILGFSGLSVQAQVASIIAQTDIRFKPFFLARIMQAIFSGIYTFIAWDFFNKTFLTKETPTIAIPGMNREGSFFQQVFENISMWGPIVTIISLTVYCFILVKRLSPRGQL